MPDISARELRNNLNDILRRLQAGERLRLTVAGRPVAELTPPPARPRLMPWEKFIAGNEGWRADPALANDLAELVLDTTEGEPIR